MITVLVTGAGGGVGQGIIKSIRLINDIDLKIVTADMSAKASGLYAGDVAYLVPACSSDDYLTELGKIFSSEKVDYYFPGTDVELEFCATYKQLIKERFNVITVISPLETVRIADNKFKTYEFLKANKFSYPETSWAAQVDYSKLSYPVIIKPVVGCRSIGVFKVYSEQELKSFMPKPEGILIQELVGTEDSEYTCTVVRVNNEISPVLVLKRVLRSGDTFRAEPVRDSIIEGYVQRVAETLKIEGSCNFQLRVDFEGVPKIFEINCRFSGTTPFCSQLGFNPVEFYLKKSLSLSYKPEINYDLIILRYWSEVAIEKSILDSLNFAGNIRPEIVSSSKLF